MSETSDESQKIADLEKRIDSFERQLERLKEQFQKKYEHFPHKERNDLDPIIDGYLKKKWRLFRIPARATAAVIGTLVVALGYTASQIELSDRAINILQLDDRYADEDEVNSIANLVETHSTKLRKLDEFVLDWSRFKTDDLVRITQLEDYLIQHQEQMLNDTLRTLKTFSALSETVTFSLNANQDTYIEQFFAPDDHKVHIACQFENLSHRTHDVTDVQIVLGVKNHQPKWVVKFNEFSQTVRGHWRFLIPPRNSTKPVAQLASRVNNTTSVDRNDYIVGNVQRLTVRLDQNSLPEKPAVDGSNDLRALEGPKIGGQCSIVIEGNGYTGPNSLRRILQDWVASN